jgi:hypothetical protein
MKVLIKIPLLVFVLLAYCILALAMPAYLGISKSEAPAVVETSPALPPAAAGMVTPAEPSDANEAEAPSETPVASTQPAAVEVAVPSTGSKTLFSIGLISKASLHVTINDLLLATALLLLFVEIFKATRTDVASILDHMLSTFVFIGYLIAFLVWAPAGTSTFLLLTMISLIDVLCGFSVSIPAARKDIAFGR